MPRLGLASRGLPGLIAVSAASSSAGKGRADGGDSIAQDTVVNKTVASPAIRANGCDGDLSEKGFSGIVVIIDLHLVVVMYQTPAEL